MTVLSLPSMAQGSRASGHMQRRTCLLQEGMQPSNRSTQAPNRPRVQTVLPPPVSCVTLSRLLSFPPASVGPFKSGVMRGPPPEDL